MENKVEIIKKRIDSPYSGGRTEFEGMSIVKEKYSNEYKVYHHAYARGSEYIAATATTDQGLQNVINRNEKYKKTVKKLEDEGYKHVGKGNYMKKNNQGEWESEWIRW